MDALTCAAILVSTGLSMSRKRHCLRRQFLPTVGPGAVYIGRVPNLRHLAPALAFAAFAVAWPAGAQPPAEGVGQAVELARATAAARAPAGARVLANVGAMDPRLQLAPCAQTEAHLPRGTPVSGRTRVGLRCTQGSVAWSIFVPVQVQVLAPAIAVATALPAGARLAQSDLSSVEVDWALGSPPFATGTDLVGRVLTRPLPAGHALRPADLQARQWFVAGDVVRIRVSGQGFAITGDGLALTNGIEGQPARVRTDQGRVLSGLPTGEKRVEVAL
jgi:flagella basal body P-ring formation protein FlgA